MRSTSRDEPRRSLLRRVVWSSVLAAAIGAAIAAATGGIATVRLVDEHEEEVLVIATRRLAEEIQEEQEEDDQTLEEALADELGDVDYVGARGAIREDNVLVAGDGAIPVQPSGRCEIVRIGDDAYRACTASHGGRQVTLAVSIAHTQALEPLFALATLLGIGVGVLTGALLGQRAVRWALGPFVALREQVKRVRPQAPSSEVLEPPAEYIEIEDLRRAVADLVERLGAALSEAQRFAAQASHELRTPLAMIAAEVELLAETATSVDADALAALHARVQSMARLVERLLVLAMPHDPSIGEAVDLADVAGEVIDALPQAERPRVKLAVADDVVVRGDATLLRALLANAVDNALKFSLDGVDVRVSGSRAEARLEVVDHGPGVSVAERDAVFEPFYRTVTTRDRGVPGSGIGLALIAHVARSHGGHAEFVDVNLGTCLRVSLPRWS